MPRKWKKISSRTVFKGKRFSVVKTIIERPDKKRRDYDFIEMGDYSGVVAVDNGRILMVRQYRPAIDEITLEIPAGKNDGQSPEKAAGRELEEETGFRAGKLTKITAYHPMSGRSKALATIFFAGKLEKSRQNPDEDEFLEVDWLPIDEVIRKITAGEIMHTPTIVGILTAKEQGLI